MVIMHRLLRSQLLLYEEEYFQCTDREGPKYMFIEEKVNKMKITHILD